MNYTKKKRKSARRRRKRSWWLFKKKRAKPKSGNVSGVKQWFYIYINFPLIIVCKIGVTGYYWKRWRQIAFDPKNFGIDLPVFGLPIYLAYDLEQMAIGIARFFLMMPEWLKYLFKGTGRTERLLLPAIIPAVALAALSFVIEWGIKVGIPIYLITSIEI